jgi:AMMECR1 domain-containing protein
MVETRQDGYSAEEMALMLKLARESIARSIARQAPPNLSSLPDSLAETRSCFVTLHTPSGELRGCIGNIGAFEPLRENIHHNALNAAFRDPRFPRSAPWRNWTGSRSKYRSSRRRRG